MSELDLAGLECCSEAWLMERLTWHSSWTSFGCPGLEEKSKKKEVLQGSLSTEEELMKRRWML